jgi:hypothetical protein
MKIYRLTIILLTLLISIALNAATIDEQRPNNIGDTKWSSLKVAVQQNKLMPTPKGFGGGKEAYLGTNIAIDGNRALVGSLEARPGEMNNQCIGEGSGFVSVLVYDGFTWQKEATLIPSDITSYGCFGYSISLSNNRALIGDFGNFNVETESGSAYLFEFDGIRWTEVHKFKSSQKAFGEFYGYSVSIDGDRAAIGALKYDDTVNNITDVGAVFIYDYSEGNWIETQRLTPIDSHSNQYFGYSVSLNDSRLLVGSPEDFDNDIFGSAYLFDLAGSNWTQTQKINASDAINHDSFGKIVKLNNDRAVIGAHGTESVYIFNNDGSTWIESQKITAFDSTGNDVFGKSLDMFGDRIVVGAYKNNNKGSAYVYDYNGLNWTFNTKLESGDGVNDDNYGYAVALSGQSVLVGAPRDDDRGENSGSIYSYAYTGANWGNTQKYITQVSSYKDEFGSAIAVSNTRAIIGSPNDNETGSAYIYDFDGSSWIQSQKLFASDAEANDLFGKSVSILGDIAVVAAFNDDNSNGSNAGAVYVYKYIGNKWEEIQKIIAPSANTSFYFGVTLVLSDTSLFIREDAGVYIYQNNGIEWIYSETLTVPLGTNNRTLLGNSISVDGNKVLIGDVLDNENGDYSGAAYIFEYNGNNWIETDKLLPSEIGNESLFGASVNLKDNRAVVLTAGSSCDFKKCIYIFEFDGTNWNETHKLIPVEPINTSKFNDKLVVSEDFIYVGSPGEGYLGSKGKIYKFVFDGTNWTEDETIILSKSSYDEYFGDSIKYSNGKLLVGAHGDDTNGMNSGAVYIFDIENFVFTNGFE